MSHDTYQFRAKNGLLIRVRPVRPADAPHLLDVFDHLGPQSRLQRFNRPLVQPTPDALVRESHRLAQIEPSEGGAWLAFADLPGEGSTPIAVARYHLVPPDAAEVALAVRDDLQGRGIGTTLGGWMAQQLRAQGVRKLVGLVRRDNEAVARLLRHVPVPLTRVEQGDYLYIEADLSQVPPS